MVLRQSTRNCRLQSAKLDQTSSAQGSAVWCGALTLNPRISGQICGHGWGKRRGLGEAGTLHKQDSWSLEQQAHTILHLDFRRQPQAQRSWSRHRVWRHRGNAAPWSFSPQSSGVGSSASCFLWSSGGVAYIFVHIASARPSKRVPPCQFGPADSSWQATMGPIIRKDPWQCRGTTWHGQALWHRAQNLVIIPWGDELFGPLTRTSRTFPAILEILTIP